MPIASQEPGIQGVPHLPQADQPGVLRLRIPHPQTEPITERIGIGGRRSVQETHQSCFTSQLPEILDAAAPRLEHQDQPIDKDGRGIASVAPGTRQIPIHQPADTQSMVELGQQSQPAMRRQGFLGPFQFESQHRLSYHTSHLVD